MANPTAICVDSQGTCGAGVPYARVTLNATAPSTGVPAWPAVQVVFLLETSPYDGVFDYLGSNDSYYNSFPAMCFRYSPYTLCAEENTVEAFIANDSVFVSRLQAEYPATRLTFGLVDFYATHDQWDDSDGSAYHVDVGNFVNATDLPAAIHNSFQTQVLNGTYILPNSSLADNMLDSSSITALYGALMGAGIGWSSDAHHVVVLIDSTVPRDPNYVVNYCQSYSKEVPRNITSASDPRCYSPSCEPTYDFGGGIVSPRCEGWVSSQDGNSSDSIATLAYTSPDCVRSLGGSCTIDVLQTNWASFFNWSYPGTTNSTAGTFYSGCDVWGNPGGCNAAGIAAGQQIFQSMNRTIAAGCDLSTATGGSWDGPFIYLGDWINHGAVHYQPTTCGTRNGTFFPPVLGQSDVPEPYYWGSNPGLYPTGACDYNQSQMDNATPPDMCDQGPMNFFTWCPWLISSLGNISLGQPLAKISLAGAPGQPLFRFVPWGTFAFASFLDFSQTCNRSGGYPVDCETYAQPILANGVSTLALNWSADANLNRMEPGDTWSASFNVVATGPPFDTPVPVDACITSACLKAGSGSVGGIYTSSYYVTPTDGAPTRTSFPLIEVTVEPLPPSSSTPTSSGPPPPPSIGSAPPLPAPVPTPTPVTLPQPVGATVIAAAGFSLPAVAAGILAAGAARVALQRRMNRVAMLNRLATSSRPARSRFEDRESTRRP